MYKQLQTIQNTTNIMPHNLLWWNFRKTLFLVAVILPAVFFFLTTLAQGEPMVFSRIAEGGFWKDNGEYDPYNTRVHSMAWFNGKLYVGTSRCILNLKYFGPRKAAFEPYPVELDTNGDGKIDPRDICWNDAPPIGNGNGEFDEGEGLDTRAQIWRYTPETGKWEMVYRSPWINTPNGKMGREYGYRSMAVLTEPDGTKALYIGSAIPTGDGAVILRTLTGDSQDDFEIISAWDDFEGLTIGNLIGIRSIVEFKGKFYTTPIGYNKIGIVYESVHENGGPPTSWRPVSLQGFKAEEASYNKDLYEMCVYNGFLYVGTLNPNGYQIWKSDCATLDTETVGLYRWKKVITDGAYRGELNESVLCMCVFQGTDGVERLYVGGAIEGGGYDPVEDIGPGTAELIRINPDDTFDLICGLNPEEVRINPETGEPILPISGMGPGFNNAFTGYFWWMAKHDGWLYVGTFDSSVFLRYIPPEELKDPTFRDALMKDPELAEEIIGLTGGFDFFRTNDGVKWLPVTISGFGSPLNAGIRRLVSTPIGLVVGVVNEFSDAPVPEGGAQVWVGNPGEIALPTDLLVNCEAERIKLKWMPSKGAIRYFVFKYIQDVGHELVDVTEDNFIVDTKVDPGVYYTYCVLADTGAGISDLPPEEYAEPAHAEDMFMFTLGKITFDRATRQFVQRVAVTNYKAQLGSVPIVLEGLTPKVTLANQAGIDESGSPFIYSPPIPANGKPVWFTLKFNNPTFAPINYVPFVVYRSK